jgi:ABC-type transporter Mla subunit MlaD
MSLIPSNGRSDDMALGRDTRARLDDTQAQISRLRGQVEGLVKELGPTVNDYANRATGAFSDATGVTREQAKAVLGGITIGQVSLVLIAAAAGWAVGRTMR